MQKFNFIILCAPFIVAIATMPNVFVASQFPDVIEEETPALVRLIPTRGRVLDELRLQIEVFGGFHNVSLVAAPHVFSNQLEEYVSDWRSGGITRITSNQTIQENIDIQSQLYTTLDGISSMHVQHRQGRVIVQGQINDTLRIEPLFPFKRISPINGLFQHTVYRKLNRTSGSCKAKAPNILVERPNDAVLQNLPNVVQPEVLLLIDYAIASHFQFKLREVKKYIGILFNSVNRRYNTITSPKIKNVITGIILTNNAKGEPYVVKGTPAIVNAGKTLSQLGKWLHQQKSVLVKHDVALWMTGLDLGSQEGNAWRNDDLGLAYVGGACMEGSETMYNVAVNEDVPGKFTGIDTVAHEMAHLYGAAHDGESVNNPPGNPGATKCPWKEGYIMSYESYSQNKFYFSPCSIEQMKFTMSSSQGACLVDTASSSQITNNITLPGTIIGLDEQCRIRHGIDYKFYVPNQSQVCVILWCAKPLAQGDIHLTSVGPSLEGSPCSPENWCVSGICTPR